MEQFTNYFSWAVLLGTGGWGVITVVKFIASFFKDEVTLTNSRNGKTITLGKHHREGLDREMLEFWE